MARRRRRSSGKKRTISPEHLAKMQEGRKRAKVHRERMTMIEEHGLLKEMPLTETERRLNSVRRKAKTF